MFFTGIIPTKLRFAPPRTGKDPSRVSPRLVAAVKMQNSCHLKIRLGEPEDVKWGCLTQYITWLSQEIDTLFYAVKFYCFS